MPSIAYWSRASAAHSSRGRLVLLEDSTHYVHYDAPERVPETISLLIEP